MFIPVFMTNAMTSHFLSSIFPGLVVMFLDSHLMLFTFLSQLDLLDVALAFRITQSKNLQITSKLLTQGYRYHKLRKSFGKFFRSYSDLLPIFGEISLILRICFGRNLSPGLLRWSSLQTKEDQMRSEFCLIGFLNSQTHATSEVWPGDHREDDRSCAWPLYSLVQIIP